MTPESGDPFGRGFGRAVEASEFSSLWAWLMAGLSMVAIGTAIIGRLFPVVMALDLVALWPVPALAVVAALIARLLRLRGVSRVVGPLLLVTWLILGVGWWSTGTPPSPSRAADILGPPQVPAEVALGISLDGELTIGPGSAHVYSVRLARRGGAVGAPDVLEARQDDAMAMTVRERPDSGWYLSSGWDVTLHPAALWRIDATARTVSLDLTGIPIGELQVAGDGTIALGDPVGPVAVHLDGNVEVSVPFGVPVKVVGAAEVPAGWESTDAGATSPTAGEGYVITVAGQGIRVTER